MNQTNDFQERGDDLERHRQERRALRGEKLCPFSLSNPNGPKPCTPDCKFYRDIKDNECIFHELRSISWNTSGKSKKAR